MGVFDTNVQYLNYKVLRELARHTWAEHDPFMVFDDIASTIVKKDEPTMRCCIYKERAIIAERMRKALGGSTDDSNVIQIIDIACDDCPEAGFVVTEVCRGCIAHRCSSDCPRDAVYYDERGYAHIDKKKCIECGLCAKACPYEAIAEFRKPCERACKVGAIYSEDNIMKIDSSKCTECGECVYKCPFGATLDLSSLPEIIKLIMASEGGKNYKVHAIVAPAVVSQFKYARTGQIISAIRELGFDEVDEVAVGADIVAYHEAEELREKGFLTSSCCPAFVTYIHNEFPEMVPHISTNLSPMAALGKELKEKDPECKVVFIGPCTAKKGEIKKPEVSKYVDYAMAFDELQAMIDSKDIRVEDLPDSDFSGASPYGRKFARTGGVSEAVGRAIEEREFDDIEFDPIVCDGMEKCKAALLRAKKGVLPNNFIEGMMCEGGCVGGAGCLTRGRTAARDVNAYGDASETENMTESVREYIDNK